jgi:D-alanyl-D-alanine carboxypeptidase
VNPSRPNRSLQLACTTAGPVTSEGAGQRNGPQHVQHVKSLRTLALGIAFGSAFAANLAATPAQAGASILIEADTGKVLRAENATYPWYPASTTKLMTLYVALQAVKQGRVTFDTLFTVSRNALAQSPTKMGYAVGTQVTVDNALKMMMVKSANDMAVLLAEGVDGSVENFADDMTRTAHRLGMTQSNFVNPNGLPADGQIVSARDMAILARALIRDFPEYNFYWHIPAIKYDRRIVRNYNTLLGRYPGADGMKTGFICASGFNLVATATRNGRQLIAVVLGSPSGGARAVKAAELLEGGFTQNPLSWLTPTLGTVDNLTPINADPPNLHDQVCGPHRKRPAAEDEDADAGGEIAGVNTPFSALLSSLRAPTPKGAALLSDFGSITPTIVYTGPTRTPDQLARLNVAADEPGGDTPHHKKKGGRAVAAKPADGAGDSTSAAKASAGNDGKTKPVHRTPTSSSSLAASPPAALETKAAADKPKKKPQKAATTTKPAPAPAQ